MNKSDPAATPGLAALEIGGRLKSSPADSLVTAAFANELNQQSGLHTAMGLADVAYTITGINTGIIPAGEGAELLSKLLDLHSEPDSYTPQAAAGDLYTNREAWLGQQTTTTGWLGAGRARREATTTAFLVLQRQQLLALLATLTNFGLALKQQASECSQACMPDYTYLQAAQPTTFGHYLAGFLYPLLRDCARLEHLYQRVNASPMGCGSTTGSRLALDRRQMAALLGFDSISVHTRDAMWQPDIPIEATAALCNVAVNMSRLAEDLQIFSSREFALVELADEHARASKIMPQKKNPFALTRIRSMSNELMGLMTSVTAMARTPSGQPDNRLWVYGALPAAMIDMINGTTLFKDVIRGMEFKQARGMQLLEDVSLMATDLAETLVLHSKLDYRSAYRLVAKLVDNYQDKGGIKCLDAGTLKQAAIDFLGQEVSMTEAEIARALDPHQSMEAHTEPGTPAAKSMSDMLDDCGQRLGRYRNVAEEGLQRLQRVEEQLLDSARALSAG